MAVAFLGTGRAADPPANPNGAATTNASPELAKLKAQLDEQQKLIEQLRTALEAQQKILEQVTASRRMMPNLGEVASTTPTLPSAPTAAPPSPRVPAPAQAESAAPLQIQIGDTTIMPVGFMDATAVWRDKNAGSGIGSNFGSVPFNNVTAGKLGEFRFSPQNSRLGFRVDGNWKGAHFIGYNEFDFLGTSGSNNLGVTNGAFVPRLRLFWIDVRKDQWEILGGQSWSMLTPNRKGISALPGDIFFSQVVDVNYMIGLPS